MADSLFDQLKARGEAFLTEVSNNLMANPTFIDMLKKGVAAKEAVDKQVGEALRNMNVITRRDLVRLEARISELEAELGSMRSVRKSAAKSAPKSAPSPSRRSAASRKKAARRA